MKVAGIFALLSFLIVLNSPTRAQNCILSNFQGESIQQIEWSPDNTTLAIIEQNSKTIKIINTLSGDLNVELDDTSSISYPGAITWNSDGTQIASWESNNQIYIWEAESGTVLKILAINQNAANHVEDIGEFLPSITWSPDDTTLAVTNGRYISIWQLDNEESIDLNLEIGSIASVAWSPDGKFIAAGTRTSQIALIDALSLQRVKFFPQPENTLYISISLSTAQMLAWSPDSKFIATFYSRGDGMNYIFIREIENGQVVAILHDHIDNIQAISWSPDSKFLASTGGSSFPNAKVDTAIRIWDMKKFELLKMLEEHHTPVTTISWNPSGDQLASGSLDGTINIWDITTCVS